MSNVQRSGSVMTWDVRCTEPAAAKGTGRIEFGDGVYNGTMTMSMEEGEMVMKLSGRRVPGGCDLAAVQREVDDRKRMVTTAMAQQEQNMDQMCLEGARGGLAIYFVGANAICTKPEHKAEYCAVMKTEKGYEAVVNSKAMGMNIEPETAARFCGVELEALRGDVCSQSLAANSLVFAQKHCPERQEEICDKALALKAHDIVLQDCPAQAQALAQRECAGRKYTSDVNVEYRAFCSSYAYQEVAKEQQAAQEAEADPKKKTMDKAKKGLKGLLGR
jgi:hypothetical protein